MSDTFRLQAWKAFGDNMRQMRQHGGLTQDELSLSLTRFWPGTSQSAIAKMERGDRLVGIDHLLAIAWVLKVAPERLLPRVVDDRVEVDIEALEDRKRDLKAQLNVIQQELRTVTQTLDGARRKAPRGTVFVPEEVSDGEHPEAP